MQTDILIYVGVLETGRNMEQREILSGTSQKDCASEKTDLPK